MSVGFELIIIYHGPKVKEVWMHVSFGVQKTEMCANSEFLPIVFLSLLQLLLSTVPAKMTVVFKDSQSLKKEAQEGLNLLI